MPSRPTTTRKGRGRPRRATSRRAALGLAFLLLLGGAATACGSPNAARGADLPQLVIREWPEGQVLVQEPIQVGDQFTFNWIHSLEKIPWDEFYHVDDQLNLVLDTIRFPAFGAGIPEDKGKRSYIKDGLIYMDQIDQVFPEIVWLNSVTATQDLAINGRVITKGASLPADKRLQLSVRAERP